MKKIALYIATSIDGKIAKQDGNVDWLNDLPNPDKLDYGYDDFYKSIDTTVMGHNTYKMIAGFDIPFPYPDKDNYVVTRKTTLTSNKDITYLSDDLKSFVHQLKSKPGKNIWLIGGAQLNALMMQLGLIDEIRLFIMPLVLGSGIPMFTDPSLLTNFNLQHSETYSTGAVELRYTKV
jgi:dihydrofolate reductase